MNIPFFTPLEPVFIMASWLPSFQFPCKIPASSDAVERWDKEAFNVKGTVEVVVLVTSSSSLHPNIHNAMPKQRIVFVFFIIVFVLMFLIFVMLFVEIQLTKVNVLCGFF